jgi:iron complex outermembrane receptor protein
MSVVRLAMAAVTILAALAQPLRAQSGELQEVSLDSLLNLDVSSASRHAQKIRQAPASITVITREDIRRYGYETIADVLNRVRGFYTSDDLNYTYLGVRGFSRPTDYNNRVLLLINGFTVNEGMYGSAALGTDMGLNVDAVERIEIARGPASALYGTSAMFAVINIVTRSASTLEGMDISTAAGSKGLMRGAVAGGHVLPGGWDLFVSGSYRDVDGGSVYFPEYDSPATNNGVAENLNWDHAGNGLVMLRGHGFTLGGWYSSRTKAFPTAAWESAFNAPGAETRDAYSSIRGTFERTLSPILRIATSAHYYHYEYAGGYPGDGYMYVDSTDANRAGVDGQAILDLGQSHRLVVGANVDRHLRADYRAGYDDGTVDMNGDFPFTVVGAYAQHEAALSETVTLTAGLRHDRTSGETSATSPRVALNYSPSVNRTIKLLYGEAFRVPSAYERNYEVYGYVRTPSLDREHIRTFELVWEERLTEWLRGEVSAYHYTVWDLIDTIENEDEETFTFANRSSVSAPGVEAELDARLPSGASLYANYAYQFARLEEDDAELTNSPLHLLKAGASVPLYGSIRAMAEGRYESSRLTVAEVRTDDALLIRAGLSVRPLRRLEASLIVDNLLDADYSTPGGVEHLQPAIPQPGRTVRVGLGMRF